MVQVIKSRGLERIRKRNESIIKEFDETKAHNADASVPDIMRGLAEHFKVSEMTIRRELKKAERI